MAATATYPPPPPYYKLYKDYIQNPNSAPEPPPPIEGTYTDDVLPSLEEQGVRQLYPTGPNIDFKNELRSLNRELQLHILELADVLVERPSQYARRVEDISLIFKNLHHLLNSLRPHQVEFFYNSSSVLSMNSLQSSMQFSVPFPCFCAFFMNSVLQGRATLIHLLESQIQRRKQAVEDIKRYGSVTLIEVFRVIEMKSLTSRGEKKRRNCLRKLLEHWMAISL
ncbi:hypothetical protein RHGRI_010370 [Rhododendron griersonianum]|uniref:Mediator of RNA polymerase II transcription subunit 7 n=1 Tax=Rhododendron griersonianum TaxID=479676 RepID=A0AAV6KIA4_9ERIC|nr:hypothetical protein RHGRI_010370 [Rhododendron griersonianum]